MVKQGRSPVRYGAKLTNFLENIILEVLGLGNLRVSCLAKVEAKKD